MLAQLLALLVGFSGFILYMAAFFFPEVHRKNDFLWSGVVLFYALVLWVYAGRITGGVLLGQLASVVLLGWLGGQTLAMRRQLTPYDQQTWVSDSGKSAGDVLFLRAVQLAEQLQDRWDRLPWPAPLRQLPARLGNRTSATEAVSTTEAPTAKTPTAKTPTAKAPTGETDPTSAEAPPVKPLATKTTPKETPATVKPKQLRKKPKVDPLDLTTEISEPVASPESAQPKTDADQRADTDQRAEPVGSEVPRRRKRPKSADVPPDARVKASAPEPLGEAADQPPSNSSKLSAPVEVKAPLEAPSHQAEPTTASEPAVEPIEEVSQESQKEEAESISQDSGISQEARATEPELPTESPTESITESITEPIEPIEPIEEVVTPPIFDIPETTATDPASSPEMVASERFESERFESEEFESEEFESEEFESEESIDQPRLKGLTDAAVDPISLAEPENFWEGSEIAPETLRPSNHLSLRPWEDRPPLPNLLAATYRPDDTTDEEWENTGLEDPLENIWDDDTRWEEGWGDTANEPPDAAVDPLDAMQPQPIDAADSEGWDMNWDSPPDTPTTIDPPPIQPIVEPILEPMDLPSLDEMFATGNRYRVSDEIVDVTAVEIEDQPRRRRAPVSEEVGDRPRRPPANITAPKTRRRPKPMLEEAPTEEKEMNNNSFFDDDDDWV